MDKYIYDDKNDLWYELQGDYYIPCLILPAEKEQPIGLWGQRHLQYLKEYRRITYLNLLTSGRLNAYLADIDKQTEEMFFRLVEQMKQAQGIMEQLLHKAKAAGRNLCRCSFGWWCSRFVSCYCSFDRV